MRTDICHSQELASYALCQPGKNVANLRKQQRPNFHQSIFVSNSEGTTPILPDPINVTHDQPQ